jgi:hypothetical protein
MRSRHLPRCYAVSAALTLLVGTAGLVPGVAPASAASVSHPRTNPVAGHPWGRPGGPSDGLWSAYKSARGTTHTMLGRFALHPRTSWYTSVTLARNIASRIRDGIAQEQNGNRNVEVWMALFRIWPHNEGAKYQPLTSADIAAYKQWMRNAARGIGRSRAAVVLEPDMPVALTGWRPSVRLGMVRWSARLLKSLPNTTVYLDGGSSDWLRVADAAHTLKQAGVQYTRGFALGITHRASAASEVAYGTKVSRALARIGVAGKHFVVDTADNGHPYTYAQFFADHPNGDWQNPPACSSRVHRDCNSLGIPPTTNVTSRYWHLPTSEQPDLRRRVDAFMWIDRSWLNKNDTSFTVPHAVAVARAWPFAGVPASASVSVR